MTKTHASDDPGEIAAELLKEHGSKRAIEVVMVGVYEAQRNGDNYRLSVLREVKRALRESVTIDR